MPRRIAIAGAGIAGLTAALAFAERGFAVDVVERTPVLEEVGAGIQLSPNATRLLGRLGVLERLAPHAVEPAAVSLRGARDLKERTRLPLGGHAQERWGAPYTVCHRADLQAALVGAVKDDPAIRLATGIEITDITFQEEGVRLRGPEGRAVKGSYLLAVAADGVHSRLRERLPSPGGKHETGWTAWRRLVAPEGGEAAALGGAIPHDCVTTFLHPRFHLVAYPVRSGRAFNLVLIAPSSMASPADVLAAAHFRFHSIGHNLERWGSWPLWTVEPEGGWHDPRGLVLIGDAAHAMSPHAAQGAAMAIEDAVTLAALVAANPGDLPAALARYEAVRRPRLAQVAARGRFNAFTWHASGPVALARDLVLKVRPSQSLMRDFDWLYDYDAERAAGKPR